MADIGAEIAGPAEADLGVHVRAVEIDLSPVRMDGIADLADGALEDAACAGVGHHDRREAVGVLLCLCLEILEIDRPRLGALDRDDLHARHHPRGRVGPVRRFGDEADIAVCVALAVVVAADREQPRVLTLAPGVGLEAHGVETGDLAEPRFELREEIRVSLHLVGRGEGVDVGELGPGHRDHLARAVELHGARAKRDHVVREAEVAVLHLPQVAEHLGLGLDLAERLVLHERGRARNAVRQL